MPTLPSQVLRHQVIEALLVGRSQSKVGLGMCQPLGAAIILKSEPPDVVLCLLQLLLSVSNAHLGPPASQYLHLEGAIPDPGYGTVDVIT